MPVMQQGQPVLIQGVPGQGFPAAQNTIPRVIPVQYQQGGASTLPPNVATLQRPPVAVVQNAGKKAEHIPLARCRVLYLGSAVPLETSQGIDAVQGPCRERYPFENDGDVNGIDAWLSVFSSGILLSYVNDKNGNTWFPIQSLYVCTAVKCVINVDGLTGEKNPRFVALDSDEAKGSLHPPMFASIMRRTKGVKVLECHVFIAKSPKASMALVQSCTHAYEHKEGWTEEPPSMVTKPNAPTRLVPAQAQEEKERQAPPEFFEKPPEQGYFYTSNKDLVKNYNVFGGQDKNNGESDQERRPPPPQAGPAPGGPGGPAAPMPQGQYYPAGPASALGPPGAPVPTQFRPPGPGMPMGMPMPPPMGVPMPHPGMYPFVPYPMPPPPPGYFSDWDKYEGRPVAMFDERNGTFRPAPPREPEIRTYQERGPGGDPRREREYREPPPREYRELPPREYREPPARERDYREPPAREYREPPRGPPREYREGPPPRDNREPPKEYREPPREYREPPKQGRRGRSKSPRKYDRPKSPSPQRQGYRPDPRNARRARSPPVDYERKRYTTDPYASRERYDDYRDEAPSDLILYAPHYRDRLPEYSAGRDYADGGPTHRREGRDYVEYTSHFNPDIVLKGNKDYRENRAARGPPEERAGYTRDDEDPYRYDRDLPGPETRAYPRPDRDFGRSLQEERETIGDAYSDAYRQNDLETGSANIEYDIFHGRQFGNLEKTLGYYP